MSRSISKRRQEMGEEAWTEYQKARLKAKIPQQNLKRKTSAVKDWRRRTKEKLMEYKGGKCEKCGYDKKIPGAYDFHHLDPSQKKFGIAANGKCRKWEDLVKEVDKCQLLCRNCHAEVEYNKHEESRMESNRRYSEYMASRVPRKKCEFCEKEFQPQRRTVRYCSRSCAQKGRYI